MESEIVGKRNELGSLYEKHSLIISRHTFDLFLDDCPNHVVLPSDENIYLFCRSFGALVVYTKIIKEKF